jgi:hypothetical protein
VLFLDELPEFGRGVLEALREPLETGRITISRAARQAEFPARFQLVAAMNPCPCGQDRLDAARLPLRAPETVLRYQGRLSGPLLDRIDLQVEVPSVAPAVLAAAADGEPSAEVAARARGGGRAPAPSPGRPGTPRWTQPGWTATPPPSRRAADFLQGAAARLGWSARAQHRTLRVARTIADLAGVERVARGHVAEAIQYRRVLGAAGLADGDLAPSARVRQGPHGMRLRASATPAIAHVPDPACLRRRAASSLPPAPGRRRPAPATGVSVRTVPSSMRTRTLYTVVERDGLLGLMAGHAAADGAEHGHGFLAAAAAELVADHRHPARRPATAPQARALAFLLDRLHRFDDAAGGAQPPPARTGSGRRLDRRGRRGTDAWTSRRAPAFGAGRSTGLVDHRRRLARRHSRRALGRGAVRRRRRGWSSQARPPRSSSPAGPRPARRGRPARWRCRPAVTATAAMPIHSARGTPAVGAAPGARSACRVEEGLCMSTPC